MTAGCVNPRLDSADLVLGIDVGGTGSRVALAAPATPASEVRTRTSAAPDGALAAPATSLGVHVVLGTLTGPRVEVSAEGTNAPVIIRRLVAAARQAWPTQFDRIVGVGIGATGIASLSDEASVLAQVITAEANAHAAVAIDAVTAHLGALGGAGGAIAVLGTGAVAIAHPGADESGTFGDEWLRVDGWGHLFGDRGGGAWLGRRALEAALRAHDRVDLHGSALLAAATGRFGPPSSWPATFYTRPDRAGLLADFAADVATLARVEDPVALDLLAEAGREAAGSVVAAAAAAGTARVAVTGGLTRVGEPLLTEFAAEVHRCDPEITVVDPVGNPLDGALSLAQLAAVGAISPQEAAVWQ